MYNQYQKLKLHKVVCKTMYSLDFTWSDFSLYFGVKDHIREYYFDSNEKFNKVL